MDNEQNIEEEGERIIINIEVTKMHCCIVGITPMIMHRMSQKTTRELLMPEKKASRSRATLEQRLKHDPEDEYRGAFHRTIEGPTEFCFPSSGFRKAMGTAAIDIPGSTKARLNRGMSIENPKVSIWGVPQLYMCPVRQSGMSRAPDIRTRPIFPEWAAILDIEYIKDLFDQSEITNLAAAAGLMVGIGDDRPEKGSGSFGKYRICSADDPDFLRITKSGGRAAQMQAFNNPKFYDDETQELFEWYKIELPLRTALERKKEKKDKNIETNGDEE